MSIYQEIWDADQAGNGIPALRQADSQLKDETVGYVIVNETDDDREARVLSEVLIPDSKRTTYALCDRLFDNYALDPGIRELVTDEEATNQSEQPLRKPVGGRANAHISLHLKEEEQMYGKKKIS